MDNELAGLGEDLPPEDVMRAAALVSQWMAANNVKEWALDGCASREWQERLARENAELRDRAAALESFNVAPFKQQLDAARIYGSMQTRRAERAEAELANAKQMLWLVIRHVGGEVTVSPKAIVEYGKANAELERSDRPDGSAVLAAIEGGKR